MPSLYCEPTTGRPIWQRLIVNVRAETGTDVWAGAISPVARNQSSLSRQQTTHAFTRRPVDCLF